MELTYWPMYAVDPELAMPTAVRPYYPNYVNHIVVCLCASTFSNAHFMHLLTRSAPLHFTYLCLFISPAPKSTLHSSDCSCVQHSSMMPLAAIEMCLGRHSAVPSLRPSLALMIVSHVGYSSAYWFADSSLYVCTVLHVLAYWDSGEL